MPCQICRAQRRYWTAADSVDYHSRMPGDESTDGNWTIQFRDPRPPRAIQFQLEKDLVILFRPTQDGERLTFSATMKSGAVLYDFELRLEAALPKINCYGFRMHASWAGLPANREYNLQSSASWFKHWTREFKPSPPPDPAEGSAERCRLLAEETLAAPMSRLCSRQSSPR